MGSVACRGSTFEVPDKHTKQLSWSGMTVSNIISSSRWFSTILTTLTQYEKTGLWYVSNIYPLTPKYPIVWLSSWHHLGSCIHFLGLFGSSLGNHETQCRFVVSNIFLIEQYNYNECSIILRKFVKRVM